MRFLEVVGEEINRISKKYKIGDLQELRKTIKKQSRLASRKIFDRRTIFENWAWHYGGRTELQFNIGIEGNFLRYGVAFSLECSQSLPSIDVLVPKMARFNEFLNEYCEDFSDLRMWHYEGGVRSAEYMPSSIPQELIREGVFIFLGGRLDKERVDYDLILDTFDRLLSVYIFVEDAQQNFSHKKGQRDFRFVSGCTDKRSSTSGVSVLKEFDIRLLHNDYQKELYFRLSKMYGEDSVGTEVYSSGLSIDLVVKMGDDFWFYEIKTSSTARACIRQALGQIMEYSYWPGHQPATKLIIVGAIQATKEEIEYVDFLRETFGLPLEYQTFDSGDFLVV
ncbi:hypothetical protein [Pseudomonas kribbensis]|uniref:Uncharacterized protein n=1 Tax=Pseudomonas kribbensis TaxID=1628086 RepID=A0A4Y8VKF4_9PSED|nr:hypothetical protein [Pseudomonas kribbensis]TFH80959.1 hypothetical protein E4J90_11930 [Pseudomonas kribbensis]